jgi:hypothetical protein
MKLASFFNEYNIFFNNFDIIQLKIISWLKFIFQIWFKSYIYSILIQLGAMTHVFHYRFEVS